MQVKSFMVSGMCCDHCVTKIKTALEAMDEVALTEVQFSEPQVKVSLKDAVAEERLISAINNAGHYKASLVS